MSLSRSSQAAEVNIVINQESKAARSARSFSESLGSSDINETDGDVQVKVPTNLRDVEEHKSNSTEKGGADAQYHKAKSFKQFVTSRIETEQI